MRTIVLGGYGNFGTRICRALSLRPNIEIIVAGRDSARAAMLAAELGEHVKHVRLDVGDDKLSKQLRALGADLVIHTAGPFQEQGYSVPLAVAKAGAHYIDLADGRRFVCDFRDALDDVFRKQGKVSITGASTVPALSSAVIDELTKDWRSIETIDFCIAPAQTAPRGVATMSAVLNYCGAPIQVWENGKWKISYGWSEPRVVEFLRMRPRRGALCDIPDLELFPRRYAGVQSVMFRAALEIGFAQSALAFMAQLRRTGFIRAPDRFAKTMNWMADCMNPFGTALGGMVVRVSGRDGDDAPVRRAWHIAADDDHGPEIPCMPSILLAERLAGGKLPPPGAHTSTSLLSLTDFAPEFDRWQMVVDVVQEVDSHGT